MSHTVYYTHNYLNHTDTKLWCYYLKDFIFCFQVQDVHFLWNQLWSKIPFYIRFFRHLHHWGWCQHIWAVWGEDSLWRGACCSQPVLLSSHIPSCIGPEDRNIKNSVSKKMRKCVDEVYSQERYTDSYNVGTFSYDGTTCVFIVS